MVISLLFLFEQGRRKSAYQLSFANVGVTVRNGQHRADDGHDQERGKSGLAHDAIIQEDG
jgi:hypothetical protein